MRIFASLFDLDALKAGVCAHDTVINLATHVPPSSRALFPGIYNVVDDEPLRRRDYLTALADVLDVPPPRLPPLGFVRLTGSVGETIARSLRISNRKLRQESGWAPKYSSVRGGYRAVVAQMERARR
jgi:nucleoside-diphosphate-sugar epimerase